MPYRTIFAGVLCEDEPAVDRLIGHAVALAAHEQAHVSFVLGVPRIPTPSASFIPMVREALAEANGNRRRTAEALADQCRARAAMAGVTGSSVIHSDSYHLVRTELVRLARASDLVVLQRTDDSMALEQDLLQAMLFDSGRPVLVVPPDPTKELTLEHVTVAWDGGSKAARAVGDAMPLLEGVGQVEVVSVAGDPDRSKRVDGAEIAQHLARHCRSVRTVQLPAPDDDIGAALRGHAIVTRADLLVMGGYGHARLREMTLGGVTYDMLAHAEFPVLLSY